MPLNAIEEALIGRPCLANVDHNHQRVEQAPKERHKIGKWTIMALVLNRTIGSGIYLTPHQVLAGTGCVSGALFMWLLAAAVSICGLYVWLECGLSMPQRRVRGETEYRGVPRSGGEKNYLEYMFPNSRLRIPHIRTTCAFSIMFLVLYNLSGNAISFGIQVLTASGNYDRSSGEAPPRGAVIGIAIAALSLVILSHTSSRRLGIIVNNCFAVVKVAFLLVIFCLGVAKAAGRFGGPGNVVKENFTKDVWKTNRTDVVSWSNSLLLCMYAFSGLEQPFYVLAETKSPRKTFPRYTVLALLIAAILFLLVNISYLLVVDKNDIIPPLGGIPGNTDIGTLFFDRLWENDHQSAARAMAAVIATSIFGNLWVMTFTAARVKQEIAKEGILPFSLTFATSYRTPYGLLKSWISRKETSDDEAERAPTAAFGLHWLTSVLLIGVTSPISDPRKAYTALVSLYAYTMVALLGCWVSIGLVLTKMRKEKFRWQQRRRYRPWLSPFHVICYGVTTAFMLVGAFTPPKLGSPFHYSVTGMPWYLIPTIGITAPFWGVLWYWGFLIYEMKIKRRQLVVSREAYWMPDPDCPGEYIQVAEIIDHTWEVPVRDDKSDDFEQTRTSLLDMKSSPLALQRVVISNDLDGGRTGEVSSTWAVGNNQGRSTNDARRLSDGFD